MMAGHAVRRATRRDPWWLIVAASAAMIRILLALSVTATPYSGDSWCLLNLGGAPPCASHPPTIDWIWRTLTFGHFTQTSVLVLQGVLGVIGTLVLFALLRQVADRRLAALGALVASLMPVTLFMERAIMTESIQDLLLLVGLLLGLAGLRAVRPREAGWWTTAAAMAFGVAAAIHSAIMMTSGGLTVMLVALVLWRQGVARTRGSLGTLVAIPVVAIVMLVAPSIPMSLRYHATFGVFSSQAMGGTYLAASWAPLLDCPAPAGSEPAVAAFYAVACSHHSFGSPPGTVSKLMWDPSLAFLRTAPSPGQHQAFAAAQSALSSAAISGIIHHPAGFVTEVGRSLWFQLAARPWTRPLHVYSTGRPTWVAGQASSGRWSDAVRSWFGGAIPAAGHSPSSLAGAVETTDRFPQVILWLVLLAGLGRTLGAAERRRRRGERLVVRGWSHRPPSDRVCVGLLATTVLLGSMISWALGSWPLFRLWAPLLPGIVILAVLAIPTRPATPVATDEPEVVLAG